MLSPKIAKQREDLHFVYDGATVGGEIVTQICKSVEVIGEWNGGILIPKLG